MRDEKSIINKSDSFISDMPLYPETELSRLGQKECIIWLFAFSFLPWSYKRTVNTAKQPKISAVLGSSLVLLSATSIL